jgi:osmotically inducible protein OsmC
MPIRKGHAVWEGDLLSGKGIMKAGSGAFESPYTFATRFGDAAGTNPDELIATAHAGCFSMALAANLAKAGFTARKISTSANLHVDKVDQGFKITRIDLATEGDVPGIDSKKFLEEAEGAKKNCPVSQALAAVEIKLSARLIDQSASVSR